MSFPSRIGNLQNVTHFPPGGTLMDAIYKSSGTMYSHGSTLT